MASAYLLSAAPNDPQRDPKAFLDLEGLRTSARVDRFGVHRVVKDPRAADLILFVETAGAAGHYFHRVRSHPVYREFTSKSYLFAATDRVVPFLPGVYASIERRWYWPAWTRSGHYPGVGERGPLRYQPGSAPSRLYSFVGAANTHPVRRRVMALRHPDAVLIDSHAESLAIRRGERPPVAPGEFLGRYARSIEDCAFVLCPRGGGTATFRLFETMMLGRVPVIVSDQWVAPDGPDWDGFSLRVSEDRIDAIPALLETRAPDARAMGEAARRAWLDWFSERASFHRTVEWCLDLARCASARAGRGGTRPISRCCGPTMPPARGPSASGTAKRGDRQPSPPVLAMSADMLDLRDKEHRLHKEHRLPTAAPPDRRSAPTLRGDSIRRNAVFALASQAATATFTAMITVFLVRALGTSQYGTLALALAFAALVAFPADFGVSLSSARFIAESRGDPAAVAAIVAKALRLKVVTSLVAVALIALAGPIASLYGQPDLAWPLRGAALALIGQNLVFLFANTFVALRRVASQFWLTLAEAAIEASATIGLVLVAATATAAAFGRAIGYLCGAIIGAALLFRLLGRPAVAERRGGPQLRQLASYGGALMIIDGAYVAFIQVPVLLLGSMLGSAAAGVYSAPLKLAAVLHYPGLAVANAVAPRVARHADHPPEVEPLARGLRQLLILQAAVATFVVVWADPIVDLVLGSGFRESGQILRALAPFIFLQGIGPLVSVSVNYLGEARRRVPIVIACLLLNVGLAIVLIEDVGTVGAAISVDISYAAYVGAHLWICTRLMALPLRPLAATAARCLPAAAGLAGVLLAFGTTDVGLLEWVLAPPLALGAFTAALILTGETGLAELVQAPRTLVGGLRREQGEVSPQP